MRVSIVAVVAWIGLLSCFTLPAAAADQGGTGAAAITQDPVFSSDPENIWRQYSAEIACTREEFDAYTRDRSRVYAVELGNVLPYETLVPFDELDSDKLSPPQAYCRLLEGSPLTRAAMMASLVHASATGR